MGKRRNTTLQIFHGAVAFKSAATKIGFISGHLSVVMAEAGGGRATGGASRLVSPLFFLQGCLPGTLCRDAEWEF